MAHTDLQPVCPRFIKVASVWVLCAKHLKHASENMRMIALLMLTPVDAQWSATKDGVISQAGRGQKKKLVMDLSKSSSGASDKKQAISDS